MSVGKSDLNETICIEIKYTTALTATIASTTQIAAAIAVFMPHRSNRLQGPIKKIQKIEAKNNGTNMFLPKYNSNKNSVIEINELLNFR
jgi:hypothetical protein